MNYIIYVNGKGFISFFSTSNIQFTLALNKAIELPFTIASKLSKVEKGQVLRIVGVRT
ncbi:MAG: hypothetical protein ABII85_06325 [Bacillota bacterium]